MVHSQRRLMLLVDSSRPRWVIKQTSTRCLPRPMSPVSRSRPSTTAVTFTRTILLRRLTGPHRTPRCTVDSGRALDHKAFSRDPNKGAKASFCRDQNKFLIVHAGPAQCRLNSLPSEIRAFALTYRLSTPLLPWLHLFLRYSRVQ